MRTSFNLPDALLERARAVARARGLSLRDLVEEGLTGVVERAEARPGYELPDLSFGGEGRDPALEDADWEAIRARAYEGHGG
jgi:hypothetical protein